VQLSDALKGKAEIDELKQRLVSHGKMRHDSFPPGYGEGSGDTVKSFWIVLRIMRLDTAIKQVHMMADRNMTAFGSCHSEGL